MSEVVLPTHNESTSCISINRGIAMAASKYRIHLLLMPNMVSNIWFSPLAYALIIGALKASTILLPKDKKAL